MVVEGTHGPPSVGESDFLPVSFRDLSLAVMPQKHILFTLINKVLAKRIIFIFRRPLSEVTDTVSCLCPCAQNAQTGFLCSSFISEV